MAPETARGDEPGGIVDLSEAVGPARGTGGREQLTDVAPARRRSPALALACAAAVACLLVVATHLPLEGGDEQAHLSTAEVQTLVPGARPAPGRGPLPAVPPAVPRPDACHTGTLAGVAVPVSADQGRWTGPTTTQVRVYATVDAYATPGQASAYASALQASVPACTPASESWHPAQVTAGGGDGAAALFTGGFADGRWSITAVVVRDEQAVTLSAEVPESRSEQGLARAARSVVDLAVLAADRAAG